MLLRFAARKRLSSSSAKLGARGARAASLGRAARSASTSSLLVARSAGRQKKRAQPQQRRLFAADAAAVEHFAEQPMDVPPKTQMERDGNKAGLAAGPLQVTQLNNGVRVVSMERHGAASSMTLAVGAGSRHEGDESRGLSHVMEAMAFKGAAGRTPFAIAREASNAGISLSAENSREATVYSAEAPRESVDFALELLAAATSNKREFDEFDVQDVMANWQDVQTDIIEGLHQAAFFCNSLGRPRFNLAGPVYQALTEHNGPQMLSAYAARFHSPKQMVLAGINVAHEEFAEMAEKHLGGLADTGAAVDMEAAEYTGGQHIDTNPEITGGNTEVAVGFQAPAWGGRDLIAACVAQSLLGGGNSFSSGGPGKGMYSRLYLNVLNNAWVEHASSSVSVYSDVSLFSTVGTSQPEDAGDLVQLLCQQLTDLRRPVSDSELSRAKNLLASQVFISADDRGLSAEELARAVLLIGRAELPAETVATIQSITAEDVQRVAHEMLSSQLSYAILGDATFAPRYDQVEQLLV